MARLIYDVPGRLWRLRRRGGQGGFSAERAERKRRSAEAGPQSKGSAFSGGVLAARREVGGRVADGAWRMVDVECPVCHPCAHSFWPWVCGPAAFGQVVQVVQVVPVVVVVIVTGRLVERKGQNGFAASGNSRPGRGRGDCRRLRFKAIQSDSKKALPPIIYTDISRGVLGNENPREGSFLLFWPGGGFGLSGGRDIRGRELGEG